MHQNTLGFKFTVASGVDVGGEDDAAGGIGKAGGDGSGGGIEPEGDDPDDLLGSGVKSGDSLTI